MKDMGLEVSFLRNASLRALRRHRDDERLRRAKHLATAVLGALHTRELKQPRAVGEHG
ncbi:MAG TPA: hypothetical protein VGW38_28805 [Chloroflexota bacterium]|nr:hypothetical protein [Chloroflexota bacterium]